eukprot:TRINITY_DN2253_c0_g1_i2.p1 TRINITY_DN2253_c0_g1~~TRINITY_DN2253_c0_g1_i2.p1  ORF type:complete len:210 (-),score=30.72 TRINITY_DN2253_c0_g1_i2:24-653(-)
MYGSTSVIVYTISHILNEFLELGVPIKYNEEKITYAHFFSGFIDGNVRNEILEKSKGSVDHDLYLTFPGINKAFNLNKDQHLHSWIVLEHRDKINIVDPCLMIFDLDIPSYKDAVTGHDIFLKTLSLNQVHLEKDKNIHEKYLPITEECGYVSTEIYDIKNNFANILNPDTIVDRGPGQLKVSELLDQVNSLLEIAPLDYYTSLDPSYI